MGDASDVLVWAKEDHSPPAGLRVVLVCLTVLAIASAAGGMIAGLILLATSPPNLGAGPLVVRMLGALLAGWAVAGLLWAITWVLRQQQKMAETQRKIVAMLASMSSPGHAPSPSACASGRLEASSSPTGADAPPRPVLADVAVVLNAPDPPEPSMAAEPIDFPEPVLVPESPAAVVSLPGDEFADAQILPSPAQPAVGQEVVDQLLAELAQVKADLLLTPQQRQARDQQRRHEALDQAVALAQQVVATGDLGEAQRQVRELLREDPAQPRVTQLQRQLADRMAAECDEAIRLGAIPLAEEMLDRLGDTLSDSPHLAELSDRLADRLAQDAEVAVEAGKMGVARRKLEQLRRRAPDHPKCAPIQERLVDHIADAVEQFTRQGDLIAARRQLDYLRQQCADHPRYKALHEELAQRAALVQDEDVQRESRRIRELMAIAAFGRAEAAAADLVTLHPDSTEAKSLLETVQREATAFRNERRTRLFGEIQRYAESRQWRRAIDAAQRLVSGHPDCPEAVDVRAMMPTLEENARIEQVREMRDQIQDLVRRRRFVEAASVAQEVIERFPQTQAARQLRDQLGRLREKAAAGEGHQPI